MKKIATLIISIVLVFSFSTVSFAKTNDESISMRETVIPVSMTTHTRQVDVDRNLGENFSADFYADASNVAVSAWIIRNTSTGGNYRVRVYVLETGSRTHYDGYLDFGNDNAFHNKNFKVEAGKDYRYLVQIYGANVPPIVKLSISGTPYNV